MSASTSPTISLRFLGGASIEGPDGPLVGRGTRGPSLAILAVVAMARGRPVSRDKLLALLWPEASTERARPLLSDSLYKLRGAVGDDAIVASNDDLRLNGERLTSDVEEFERLLEMGEDERAVALYAGPFLDGFHLTDATELERWIEGERRRLAARLVGALDALASARERAGDWPGAVAWLKRLAAHDPYAGRVAARLMLALEASGNRAAAMQHARVHAVLLRQELDAEPDAEVTALVERLRNEPLARVASPTSVAPPAPVAPHASVAPPASPVADASSAPNGAPAPNESPVSPTSPASLDRAATSASGPLWSLPATESPGANAPARRSPRGLVATDAGPPHAANPPAATTGAVTGRERSASRLRFGIAAAALLVILIAALASSDRLRAALGTDGAQAERPATSATRSSIAVLPFDDLGPSGGDAYFSDGLAEEIIGRLSMVEGLRVAARSSSFALRGARLDARTMGDTLGVVTLLEGSVRREGNRVRVTARLVDAGDGFQLWSRAYDRGVDEVITLQDEIATEIVGALALQLATPLAVRERPIPDTESYDLFLRGIHARNQLSGESLRQAVDYFDRAIRLDSAYAPAYAGKATTLLPMVWGGYLPRAQVEPLARDAARRAVALDESLSEAHVALGMIALYLDWDWATAERELRQAVALNPNDAHAHHFLANAMRVVGRFDEAIASRSRAFALDRLSVRTELMLGADYFSAGRDSLAAVHYRRATELAPQSPVILGQGPGLNLGTGHVYQRWGMLDSAMAEYLRLDSLRGVGRAELAQLRATFASSGIRSYWRRRVEQVQREGDTDPVKLAWMWARAGDAERAVTSLERAYRERNVALVFLAVQPDFVGLHSDPRVAAILKAMRLRPVV